MIQFFHQYRNIQQTRELIEKSFKEYVRNCRLKKIKSTNYQGQQFLNEIQEHMKQIYRSTKMGELLPNGYPIIVWIRNSAHSQFGIAVVKVNEMLKFYSFSWCIRISAHSDILENDKIVDNPMVLWIKRKIEEKYKIQFGIPLIPE